MYKESTYIDKEVSNKMIMIKKFMPDSGAYIYIYIYRERERDVESAVCHYIIRDTHILNIMFVF